MKKMISQLCTATILLGSLNVSAYASSQNQVRDILAQYSSSVERGDGQIKSLTEATLALKASKVSSQQLVEYITADMTQAEAASYRANVLPGLALTDADNVDVLFKQAAANMGLGANFRGCRSSGVGSFIAGITAAAFILTAIEKNRTSENKKDDIKQMQLKKTDLESDIKIYIGEGVKPDSFLIASVQKDIAYLDVQMAQAQNDSVEAKKKAQNYFAVGAAAGVVTAIGAATNCY